MVVYCHLQPARQGGNALSCSTAEFKFSQHVVTAVLRCTRLVQGSQLQHTPTPVCAATTKPTELACQHGNPPSSWLPSHLRSCRPPSSWLWSSLKEWKDKRLTCWLPPVVADKHSYFIKIKSLASSDVQSYLPEINILH